MIEVDSLNTKLPILPADIQLQTLHSSATMLKLLIQATCEIVSGGNEVPLLPTDGKNLTKFPGEKNPFIIKVIINQKEFTLITNRCFK
jgi:hypothetical protein